MNKQEVANMTQHFSVIQKAVAKRMKQLQNHELFIANVDKDLIWETYLGSFPEGSNPIYKTNTEHDCNCCKQFVRNIGRLVAINDRNELETVWDIDVGGAYQVVADAMAALVRSSGISALFRTSENQFGQERTHKQEEDGDVTTFNHFHYTVVDRYKSSNVGRLKGDAESNMSVFKRSLEEISAEATTIVLELIQDNAIYRGEEHLTTVQKLREYQREYAKVADENKEAYLWATSNKLGIRAKIKNTVIGTLLTDITDGVELERAVKSFEDKVAPTNYKRPKALVTQGMIKKAQEKVEELGIEQSLHRRHATDSDISLPNVLWANREAKKNMGLFEELASEVADKAPDLKKVTKMSIDKFVKDVLPKAETIEAFFAGRQKQNLVSLVAPQFAEAPNILKWGNNFSWSYNGEVTDSMKERVKAAGGNVTGDLRFSLQWNDDKKDQRIDLDAHCRTPVDHIYFSNKRGKNGGVLDVDIITPGNDIAVENITWPTRSRMADGEYKFQVHNYSGSRSHSGFTAEIEFDGNTYSFTYDKPLRGGEYVDVATITLAKGEFLMKPAKGIDTEGGAISSEVWGVNTNRWNKVKMIMNSPNHWDGEKTGNRHMFFMLDGCANPDPTRGLYNEYLSGELNEHRKVFEMLGSKLRVQPSEDQLSGLGFSSTKDSTLLVRVRGSYNRIIEINFK